MCVKQKGLILTTIVFFLIVNTSYYWEGKLGIFAFPAFFLLMIVYVVLAFLLFRQLYIAGTEAFSVKHRLWVIGWVALVLTLTFFKPSGLVDFDSLQGDDLLVAEREGVANCMTVLKLKENKQFRERNVCFGVTEIKGSYELKGDTVFFKDVEFGRGESEYYKFAVIKRSGLPNKKIIGDLIRYKSYNDTTGHELWITKDKLIK